ncbi:translation initiation factor IF-2 [Coemansia sp. RSA 2050]|nr:translation initiation factor IF-2 [Coemansia sp. RSA 2050]KAJ2729131.1 translation initiation factor IF-2 [Coemansia sp. BCRC 34962]
MKTAAYMPRAGHLCPQRSHLSLDARAQLQRELSKLSQAKDNSANWARPGSARATYSPQLSNRPIIGGHARNNLKSAHAASSGLNSKPFFEEDVSVTPASTAVTRNAPSVIDVKSPEPAARQPLGAPRFFFMNRKQGAPAELPSVTWAAAKDRSAPGGADQQQQQTASETGASLATATGSVQGGNATATTNGSGSSSSMSKLMQAFIKKTRVERESKGAEGQSAPQRLQERQRPEIKTGKKKDQPKRKEVEHGKRGSKAAPMRASPNAKQFSRGHGALRRSVLDKDEDQDRAKGRRKRFTLPKKGLEVTLPLTITVDGLAKLLDVQNSHLMRKMANIGMDKLASDYLLTNEEAAEIALEYEVVPIIPDSTGPELYPRKMPEDMSVHPLRPPVVTIMGHVDHGKTTLLDTLRNSSITAGEAGGITQHIGAFSVQLKSGQAITFLDTPGHAAFSAMRARGANATDIVVLVVAADDGVMPQTKEAIQHALDADVPIIVAINKCDKHGVDPSRIKDELLKHGIQTEDLGGDIQAVEISALKGTGVEELSESIVTLAEILDLRAEVDIPAQGTVIESQIERGRGNVASVLIKRGTLKVGDIIVAGTAWCKVRSMSDDRGNPVKEAGPASAVEIMGWKEIPKAGDMVLQAENEGQAKSVVDCRVEKRKNKDKLAAVAAMNVQRRETHERDTNERFEERAHRKAVWEFHNGLRDSYPEPPAPKAALSKDGGKAAANSTASTQLLPVVPVVIKGDVSGTVEAVASALKQLPDKKIKVNVISTGVGAVSESDVVLAGSGNQGVVVAFNVKADKKTQAAARREKVDIMSFRVIYKLLEDVEKLLISRLEPIRIEEIQGEAVIQEIFEITLKGNTRAIIAGSRMTVGSLTKAGKVRVLRDGKELFTGDVSSLKNVRHDISEATKGQEFGVSFAGFEDMKEGDIIQSLRYKEVPQKLA